MKVLTLSQSKVAFVSEEDFEWASQWKWSVQESGRVGSGIFYAMRMERRPDGKRKKLWLHKEIALRAFGAIPENCVPHHKQSTLDCTRENLEVICEDLNRFLARKKRWESRNLQTDDIGL